jgi:hypothetical protein
MMDPKKFNGAFSERNNSLLRTRATLHQPMKLAHRIATRAIMFPHTRQAGATEWSLHGS